MRANRGGNGGNVNFDFGGIDLGDIFGDMFGFGGSARGGQGRARQRRGNDIQVDIQIDFSEAVFGVEKEVRLTKNNACDVCNGSGVEPGSAMETCATCKGRGQVQQVQRTIFGAMQSVATCGECMGQGQIPKKKCKHCGGDGTVRNESNFKIKIPAGIDNGQSIRLQGKGEHAGSGSVAGDLYVLVHVKLDNRFAREGYDIFTEVKISYPQAVLGDTIEIDTVDGRKNLVIPEGTQPGQRIRLKGRGVGHLQGSGRGDQYVTVVVDVPKKISKKAKGLLEELRRDL